MVRQARRTGSMGSEEVSDMEQDERLAKALETLRNYVLELGMKAGKSEEWAEELWERIKGSNGVLRELAYYHDYGEFLGEYKVAGFGLTDVLVWQVDHFKAYMDRHEEMNRYRTERLFLESLDVLLKMEQDPKPFVEKMKGETGTDFADKY
ncbi:MAG: hypothetical protein J6X14_00620 [Lachnospiraceae bacterium]|nr:hypothetical protein [Lachnospiraceae bacterium]MBP5668797.1 hypothetical protein [Lachnospiraceae bacterium]